MAYRGTDDRDNRSRSRGTSVSHRGRGRGGEQRRGHCHSHSHEQSHGDSHGPSHDDSHGQGHGHSRGQSHDHSRRESHGHSQGHGYGHSHGQSHDHSQGQGHGHSHGQSHGHSQEQGHGHSRGQSHGHSQEQGHGHSRGQSHGHSQGQGHSSYQGQGHGQTNGQSYRSGHRYGHGEGQGHVSYRGQGHYHNQRHGHGHGQGWRSGRDRPHNDGRESSSTSIVDSMLLFQQMSIQDSQQPSSFSETKQNHSRRESYSMQEPQNRDKRGSTRGHRSSHDSQRTHRVHNEATSVKSHEEDGESTIVCEERNSTREGSFRCQDGVIRHQRPSRGHTVAVGHHSFNHGPQSVTMISSSVSALHTPALMNISEMENFVNQMLAENIIQYSDNPRQDVQRFFDEEVMLKQTEIEIAATHFNGLQDRVVTFLEDQTNWKWNVCRVGSYYDKTKVSRPNEMDCVLVPDLPVEIEAVFGACYPGYCKVKVKIMRSDESDTNLEKICDGPFINADKYRQLIFELLEIYVEKNSKGLPSCKKNVTHAASPSFGIIYSGVKTDHGALKIDIDFVPALKIAMWPSSHVARDLTTQLAKDISQHINIDSELAKGFNITTKRFSGAPPGHSLQWMISFSHAEKHLTLHGETSSWKPVLRTMKRVVEIAKGVKGLSHTGKTQQIETAAQYIREKRFQQADLKLALTTYHIRTLMWTLLYSPGGKEREWKEESKVNRLLFSLENLRLMLTGEKVVPHFFLQPQIPDIMKNVRDRDREFMYILARATEILFSRQSGRGQ